MMNGESKKHGYFAKKPSNLMHVVFRVTTLKGRRK